MVELDAAPSQRKYFAETHAREQRNHRQYVQTMPRKLGDEGGHVLHDDHVIVGNLGCRLHFRDIAGH
jgi:hypothetical protein